MLTHVNFTLPFESTEYVIRGVRTAYGDTVVYASDWICMLTNNANSSAATKHFCKLAEKHTKLKHNDQELQEADDIKVEGFGLY